MAKRTAVDPTECNRVLTPQGRPVTSDNAHAGVVAGLEPFALQPDGLLQQGRPQLEQPLGTLLEHPEDRLSVGHVERDDPGFAVVGAFEPFGGVTSSASRRLAASQRTVLSATGIPASHMPPTVHMFGSWCKVFHRGPGG